MAGAGAAAGLAAGLAGYAATSRVAAPFLPASQPPPPPRRPPPPRPPPLPPLCRPPPSVRGTAPGGFWAGARAQADWQARGGGGAVQDLWAGWGLAARELAGPGAEGAGDTRGPELLLGPEFRGAVARGWNLSVDAAASATIAWLHDRGW